MNDVQRLWPLIQAIERAAWRRKWSELQQARKVLEAAIGPRPHDPLFGGVIDEVRKPKKGT